jgi:hypothetical protein
VESKNNRKDVWKRGEDGKRMWSGNAEKMQTHLGRRKPEVSGRTMASVLRCLFGLCGGHHKDVSNRFIRKRGRDWSILGAQAEQEWCWGDGLFALEDRRGPFVCLNAQHLQLSPRKTKHVLSESERADKLDLKTFEGFGSKRELWFTSKEHFKRG